MPCSSQRETSARMSGCALSSGSATNTSSIAWLAARVSMRPSTAALPVPFPLPRGSSGIISTTW